jgi:hypothetical protein
LKARCLHEPVAVGGCDCYVKHVSLPLKRERYIDAGRPQSPDNALEKIATSLLFLSQCLLRTATWIFPCPSIDIADHLELTIETVPRSPPQLERLET